MNVPIITDPNLSNITTIQHGFFSRQGGVSETIYHSLNISARDGDPIENITENLNRIKATLSLPDRKLYKAKQTHSTDVITVTNDTEPGLEGDGLVTNQPDIILGISTALCTLFLFSNKEGTIIGAAHAGWKGALHGIIENTIDAMKALGATIDDITAVIGPTIHQPSYEVSNEFYQQFIAKDPSYDRYFIDSKHPNHYMFDLPGFVIHRLTKAGVHAYSVNIDTYPNREQFFSYRRSCHLDEEDYGCQLSTIAITS